MEETAAAIRLTVDDVQKKSGLKLSEVVIGISNHQIFCSKNRGFVNLDSSEHKIKKDEVKKLTNDIYKIRTDPEEEIMDILPQLYSVENEHGIRNPAGLKGKNLEGTFYVIMGDALVKQNIIKCISLAGLKVKKIILEPLASAEAVLSNNEKETGVILVDIGAGTTTLVIYENGVVKHIAMIPFGGNQITIDIMEHLFISWSEAEKIKTNYRTFQAKVPTGQKKQLTSVIQARMEEILNCIIFEMEKSGIKEKLHAGMVITGGGAMLKNLPQLIKSKTGMNVRVGYPNVTLSNHENHTINHPMFSSSIGLILKGYE
jgi:cell division protein FtsA